MCWQLYLASDRALPTVKWNAKQPDFHVTAATKSRHQLAHQHFSKPHLYLVGSDQGCGCGFDVTDPDEPSERDREAIRQLQLLADYLAAATSRREVELLACWLDDEQRPPDRRQTVDGKFFVGGFLAFGERTLYTVTKPSFVPRQST
jgi:hypothetical protein